MKKKLFIFGMFEGYIICYITFIFIKEIVGSIFIIELKLTIFD